MAREIDVKALISHLITGDGLDRCRICMGDTSEGQVFLDDTILIEDNNPVSLGDLLKSVTGVEVETSEILPMSVCKVCTNGACMAALFIQQMHSNNEKINNILAQLNSIKLERTNIKTLYATITDSDTIEIHPGNNETKTIKDACVKLKKRMIQMKAKKRRSEIIEKSDDHDENTINECTTEMPAINEMYKKNRKCPNCGKSFLSMYYLGLHLKHGRMRLCWKCHEIINLKTFHNHLEQHENLTHFKCAKCYDAFSSQRKLDTHLKLYHRGHLSCHICKYSYNKDQVLSAHLTKHESEKCSKCKRNFYNRRCAGYHAKTCKSTSNEDSFICDYCAKEFHKKRSISRHMREFHLGTFSRNFKCELCHKCFRVRAHLKEHYETHLMKQDRKMAFTCAICQSKFYTKRGYDEHTKKHVNPEIFSCDICQSKFVTKGGLRKHYKKHFTTLTEINIINIEGAEFLTEDNLEFA